MRGVPFQDWNCRYANTSSASFGVKLVRPAQDASASWQGSWDRLDPSGQVLLEIDRQRFLSGVVVRCLAWVTVKAGVRLGARRHGPPPSFTTREVKARMTTVRNDMRGTARCRRVRLSRVKLGDLGSSALSPWSLRALAAGREIISVLLLFIIP